MLPFERVHQVMYEPGVRFQLVMVNARCVYPATMVAERGVPPPLRCWLRKVDAPRLCLHPAHFYFLSAVKRDPGP